MFLAIIPARSGSKGIKNKNIKLFCGKPLIQWSIEAALKTSFLDRIIVSTDSQEYADLAINLGAEVPFIRPAKYAQDDSPSIDLILHALDNIPEARTILLLQPTSPLRDHTDIESIYSFWKSKPNQSVVSISKSKHHPSWMFELNNDLTINSFSKEIRAFRRQDLPDIYLINGSIYLASRNFLLKEKSFISPDTLGFIMPKEKSIDIDDEKDWIYAEALMNKIIDSRNSDN
tara:strand:+ start:1430 stop:2122 length:693 start_codon:yes stop_codon:yes gene_type:complete